MKQNDLISLTISALEKQGFNNIQKLQEEIDEKLTISSLIRVTSLEENSNYTIVKLNGIFNEEFKDLIYVAIENETNILLEIAKVCDSPKIYSNQEMKKRLQILYPNTKFEILEGYFWKLSFELRSRFSVARRFRINDQEMFLLPNGDVVEQLKSF